MILAEEVEKYIDLSKYDLAYALERGGYTGISFESVKFIGITNGGEFCYKAVYYDDSGLGEVVDKVFVKKDATGKMIADY